MLDVRAAWFDGNYGPPPGNKRAWAPGRMCAGMAGPLGVAGPALLARRQWRRLGLQPCPAVPPTQTRSSAPAPPCPRLPPAAAVPHERDQWQQPQAAYSISERGKAAAAAELAKQLQERIRLRGCKEEFVPNAELLAEGKVRGKRGAAGSSRLQRWKRLRKRGAAVRFASAGSEL